MTRRIVLLLLLCPACGGRSSLSAELDLQSDQARQADRALGDRLRVDAARPDLVRPDRTVPDLPDLSATWAISLGGKEPDQADAIAVDPWGNVLVTGYFGNTVSFGSTTFVAKGSADAFVAKISPAGKILWARAIGNAGFDRGRAITSTASGDVLVSIEFNDQVTVGSKTLASHGGGDVLVVRFTPDGDPVWASSGGGLGLDFSTAIAADGDGIHVVGTYFDGAWFGSTSVACPGRQALFLTRLNHAGDFVSTLTGDASFWSHANGVALESGSVYFAGEYSGELKLGGFTLPSYGGSDVFVGRLTALGKLQWLSRAGGALDDAALSIAVSQGHPVITGYLTNTATFGELTIGNPPTSVTLLSLFVASLSPEGSFQWASTAPGTQGAEGTAIVGVADGSVVVGKHATSIDGIPIKGNAFVARASTQGKLPWAESFIGTPRALATDSLGHGYVAGQFYLGATIAGTKLLSSGVEDAFVWKLQIP